MGQEKGQYTAYTKMGCLTIDQGLSFPGWVVIPSEMTYLALMLPSVLLQSNTATDQSAADGERHGQWRMSKVIAPLAGRDGMTDHTRLPGCVCECVCIGLDHPPAVSVIHAYRA